MADEAERPWKTQALVAACIDIVHIDVRSRRLNDPSRDVPGDVQVYVVDDVVILAAEARAKAVSDSDVKTFVAACASAFIDRAFVVVDSPQHVTLATPALREWAALTHNVSLNIFESVKDLLVDALTWSGLPITQALSNFASAALGRLVEIEADQSTIAAWRDLCDAISQAGDNHSSTVDGDEQASLF